MSLQTLRDIRLQRLRPPQVELVTMSCPRPNWRWLLEDPAIVWLPAGSDVRAHDLRPLVGLPVTALVDDLERRRSEVGEAVAAVGEQGPAAHGQEGEADMGEGRAGEGAERAQRWQEGALLLGDGICAAIRCTVKPRANGS